jgi:hypothetical protein
MYTDFVMCVLLYYKLNQKTVTPLVKKAHMIYTFFFFRFSNLFAICIETFKYNQQMVWCKIGDQDISCAPHTVFAKCAVYLSG